MEYFSAIVRLPGRTSIWKSTEERWYPQPVSSNDVGRWWLSGLFKTCTTIRQILQEKHDYNDYFEKDGILHKLVKGIESFVVPRHTQREVIRRAHEKGHFEVKTSKMWLLRNFLFLNLKKKLCILAIVWPVLCQTNIWVKKVNCIGFIKKRFLFKRTT